MAPFPLGDRTNTLDETFAVIRRQTLPPPDQVLKNSAFGLMTDRRIPLSSKPRRRKLISIYSRLDNFRAKYSGFNPGSCRPARRAACAMCRTDSINGAEQERIMPSRRKSMPIGAWARGIVATTRESNRPVGAVRPEQTDEWAVSGRFTHAGCARCRRRRVPLPRCRPGRPPPHAQGRPSGGGRRNRLARRRGSPRHAPGSREASQAEPPTAEPSGSASRRPLPRQLSQEPDRNHGPITGSYPVYKKTVLETVAQRRHPRSVPKQAGCNWRGCRMAFDVGSNGTRGNTWRCATSRRDDPQARTGARASANTTPRSGRVPWILPAHSADGAPAARSKGE